jgi:hypothetical protein
MKVTGRIYAWFVLVVGLLACLPGFQMAALIVCAYLTAIVCSLLMLRDASQIPIQPAARSAVRLIALGLLVTDGLVVTLSIVSIAMDKAIGLSVFLFVSTKVVTVLAPLGWFHFLKDQTPTPTEQE